MATNLLNQENIIKKVYDPPTQSLKVTGTSVVTPGQMEVAISDLDDSIKIGDGGGNYATVAGGALNVNVVSGVIAATTGVSKFNEVLAVASGAVMVINTYTVPLGKTATISKIDVSGDNIAKYTVYVNGVVQDIKRTYFGSQLNASFDFKNEYKLLAGNVVTVEVDNFRPSVADFNARISVVET